MYQAQAKRDQFEKKRLPQSVRNTFLRSGVADRPPDNSRTASFQNSPMEIIRTLAEGKEIRQYVKAVSWFPNKVNRCRSKPAFRRI